MTLRSQLVGAGSQPAGGAAGLVQVRAESNSPRRPASAGSSWSRSGRIDEATYAGRSAAGFTLLELIVVLVLIGLLVGIALPAYRDATQRAKEAALRENLARMREAIDEYHTDKGQYPPALEDLVMAGYLRALPVDPITESASSWEIEYAPWEMVEEGDIAGVFNVHSGADDNALDGTLYAEW